jgi:hypothetical protein
LKLLRSVLSVGFALALALALASPGSVGAVSPGPGTGLGSAYPGATLVTPKHEFACGVRYKIKVAATIGRVADFYLAQGRAAKLTPIGDTLETHPDFRIITFGEKPSSRFLGVIIDDQGSSSTVSVT